jgi:hypothetical protein
VLTGQNGRGIPHPAKAGQLLRARRLDPVDDRRRNAKSKTHLPVPDKKTDKQIDPAIASAGGWLLRQPIKRQRDCCPWLRLRNDLGLGTISASWAALTTARQTSSDTVPIFRAVVQVTEDRVYYRTRMMVLSDPAAGPLAETGR